MNLMNDHEVDLNLLFSLTTRPPLYMRSGNYIWTDDHVGRQMPKLRLDPNIDSARLKHSTIDNQADWITNLVGNPNGKRLLGIGCGPGLFCERFHSAGFSVRGMDFNTHSIAYARKSAETGELSIEYVYGDYVHMQAKNEFDVITLINRDFSALTVSERDLLLRAARRRGRLRLDGDRLDRHSVTRHYLTMRQLMISDGSSKNGEAQRP